MEISADLAEQYAAIRQQLESRLDAEILPEGFAYQLVLDTQTRSSARFGLIIYRQAAEDPPDVWKPDPATLSWIFQHMPKDLQMRRMSDRDIITSGRLVKTIAKGFPELKVQIHPHRKAGRLTRGYLYVNIWLENA